MPAARTAPRLGTSRLLAAILAGWLALAGVPLSAAGQPDVSAAPPSGFEDLEAAQEAIVDLYFGGRRIGSTTIEFTPAEVTFKDPSGVLDMLPPLADRDGVFRALSGGPMPANGRLVCTIGADPSVCGRLSPELVGIIFDQDRFRLDLFVNPGALATQSAVARDYLVPQSTGIGLVSAVGGVISGNSSGEARLNLQDRLLIGDANRRLRSELVYATDFGLEAETLVAELDRPGWRYMAGAFWAPGTDLVSRRRILGAGVTTQIDTRRDKDVARGIPLSVFLGQRSRVDILRDGRVIATRIYEAGNQALDTSNLPDGSYEVVLRIEEAGGSVREERRFYSKNRNIPSRGEQVLYAYAGFMGDESSGDFLSVSDTPFFQGGIARRISDRLALDANVLVTEEGAYLQAGANFLSPLMQLRVATVASSQGDYGGLVQVNSQGSSNLGFNFDLRRISVADQKDGPETLPVPFDPLLPDAQAPLGGANPRLLGENSFTQFVGNLSYRLEDAQLGLSASYRKQDAFEASYSIGPSFRWNVLRRDRLLVSFNGDAAFTDRGEAGFVGVSLRLLSGRSTFGASGGFRSSNMDGRGSRSRMAGTVFASTSRDGVLGGQLDLGASYERDIDKDLVTANADLRAEKASFAGQLLQGLGDQGGPMQYSLAAHTILVAKGGEFALAGRNTTDSVVMVHVEGASDKTPFEVIVNNIPSAVVRSEQGLALALPPYRAYDIRVRPTRSSELVSYDGSVQRVDLFPGNVVDLTWQAKRIVPVFGRLLLPDGSPVRRAMISAEGEVGASDENGYFQIMAARDTALEVRLTDGSRCEVALPELADNDTYVALGTLACEPGKATFRMVKAD